MTNFQRWRAFARLAEPWHQPRVLASVLLDGLLARIRTSGALEESLSVRLEFRWQTNAFNLHRLMSLIREARAGPAPS